MKRALFSSVVMDMLVLFFLTACNGGGGSSAGPDTAASEHSVVTAIRNSAPAENCANNGISVDAGIDTNGNSVIDSSEITSTQYVCNAATVSDGLLRLVLVTNEPPGANCESGGRKVSVGKDENKNNVLDAAETTSSVYLCTGAAGQEINALVRIIDEPAGGNCAAGGLMVTRGFDTDADGSLDPEEEEPADYVCNSAGTVIITGITADPPVVRPNESTTLAVSANDGAGSSLTYLWSALQGSLTSTTTSSTTWTAPGTVGSYLVSVQVSNGISTATGYAAILVSVSPAGPVITSVSPAETRSDDTITITGAGFGPAQGSSTVTIGSVAAASITSWSENQVKAVVPSGAVTGSVIITISGVASSPGYVSIPWSNGNLRLTDVVENPQNVSIVSDGNGGAIIVWEDYRDGMLGNSDIYAQRVNRAGTPQWTANGIAITTATGFQKNPQLVPDDSGGAIITWQDERSGTDKDLYAQRVNGAGAAQWTANGVAISTASGDQDDPRLVPDGSGGAIITWQDFRSGTDKDLYAQRVNGAGAAQWTANGVAISTASGDQDDPRLVPDGSGGAIITWQDFRSGTDKDLYAQRVNGAGAAQWAADGVAICTAENNQLDPRLVPDGSGGAIITWNDFRSGTNGDIYAQRVNGAGAAQWTANGIAVAAATSYQERDPQLVPDGSGGAIITWHEFQGQWAGDWWAKWQVNAKRVNGTGAAQWSVNIYIPYNSAYPHSQYLFTDLITDGSGGLIIALRDFRSAAIWDIHAQRVNEAGSEQWTAGGVAMSTTPYNKDNPHLAPDGSGGAIITWTDEAGDIYAQRVNASGQR
jgi:IPT/TIG domain-containing protein/PKD domain-containing protein